MMALNSLFRAAMLTLRRHHLQDHHRIFILNPHKQSLSLKEIVTECTLSMLHFIHQLYQFVQHLPRLERKDESPCECDANNYAHLNLSLCLFSLSLSLPQFIKISRLHLILCLTQSQSLCVEFIKISRRSHSFSRSFSLWKRLTPVINHGLSEGKNQLGERSKEREVKI